MISITRSLLVSILLILLFHYAHGSQQVEPENGMKTRNQSDREKAGLRGSVQRCTEETIYPADKTNNVPERKTSTTTEYDLDGRILSLRTINQDGSEWVTTRTYAADGRLLKVTSTGTGTGSDMPATEQIYSYNEAGRLVSITNSREDSHSTRFEYDAQGRKTKIESFALKPAARDKGLASGTNWAWEGADTILAIPQGGTVTTLYNEGDQATEAQIRDAQGRLVIRILRTYDVKGHVKEDKQVVQNAELMVPEELKSQLNPAQMKSVGAFWASHGLGGTVYTYDGQGRTTEARRGIGSVMEDLTKLTYNERNDVVEERRTQTPHPDLSREFSLDDNGKMVPSANPGAIAPTWESETRHEYQYDGCGNWTEQTITFRSRPSEASKVSEVHHRQISYY